MKKSSSNPFLIFGVPPSVIRDRKSFTVVERGFRRLSKILNPDRHADEDKEFRSYCTKVFQEYLMRRIKLRLCLKRAMRRTVKRIQKTLYQEDPKKFS